MRCNSQLSFSGIGPRPLNRAVNKRYFDSQSKKKDVDSPSAYCSWARLIPGHVTFHYYGYYGHQWMKCFIASCLYLSLNSPCVRDLVYLCSYVSCWHMCMVVFVLFVWVLSQQSPSNYPEIQRQRSCAALTGGASFPECSQGPQTAITPLNRPIKMIHITVSHNCKRLTYLCCKQQQQANKTTHCCVWM